jgi:hypothetical protein
VALPHASALVVRIDMNWASFFSSASNRWATLRAVLELADLHSNQN